MTEATLCLIVDRGRQRLLLGEKKRGFGHGKLNGFGGKPEPGESLLGAAVREVEEESGLRLRSDRVREVAEITFLFPFHPAFDHHVHVFLANEWSGEPIETSEMIPVWYSLNNVPYERMWADDRHWIPHILAGEQVEARFTFAQDNETLTSWNVRSIDGTELERGPRD